jgi:hypothetical protein
MRPARSLCTIAPTGSLLSTCARRTARPVDLWTTLCVAHRVHRTNSSSNRSLRNEEASTMSPNTRSP